MVRDIKTYSDAQICLPPEGLEAKSLKILAIARAIRVSVTDWEGDRVDVTV